MQRSTVVAIGILAAAIFTPAAMAYFSDEIWGKSGMRASAGSNSAASGDSRVWLTTPAFTISGPNGAKDTFIAALRLENSNDANAVCPWMPLVRDRIQVLVADIEVRRDQFGDPAMFLEERRLKGALAQFLSHSPPDRVAFVSAKAGPARALSGGTRVLCDGPSLNKNRSPLFTG